jgi:peptidoglycan/LPS O-acetylase OafA/YrhL
MQYRPEIDGLRALAVMPVIFFHAGFGVFAGGYVGVDVFFVISGYLITSLIVEELHGGRFSLVGFYERRARRILPALIVVALACVPFAWLWLLPAEMRSFSKSLVAIAAFVSNLFFWSERGYFGTAIELKPLIHTWSLAVEEQFYLFFPLLLMIFVRGRRAAVVLLGAISLALCLWLSQVHVHSAFYLLPTRLWELAVGAAVALWRPATGNRVPGAAGWSSLLEGAGLSMIVAAVLMFDERTTFPGWAATLPVAGAALVIAYGSTATVVGRLLATRALVGLGLISYSAYLWHQPMLAFARHRQWLDAEGRAATLAIVATLALAWLSWRFVERPFRDRSAWSRGQVFFLSAAGLLLLAGIGIAGWRTDGFLAQRYPPQDQALLAAFIDGGDYTAARFDRLKLAAFAGDPRKKRVMVIGDSHAKDLVNAVAETELSHHLELSTHQINAECGNLFVGDDLSSQIGAEHRARCRLMGWYDSAALRERMEQADAIWLASAWLPWVIDRLPQSVRRIEATYGKPVLVFGRKNFGQVSEAALLSLPPAERPARRQPIRPANVEVNAQLRRVVAPAQFIDVSRLMCGDDTHCPLFTAERTLKTYDGVHLTRAGAVELGRALAIQAPVKALIEP